MTWVAAADAAYVVDTSSLPPDVRALVTRVVRATRLRKAEKADVARELVSHFEEALAAGRTPAEAIRAFGDEHHSAKSLRHAARAKRSLPDRAFSATLRWSGRGLAVVVVAYVAFAAYLWTQHPKIAFDPVERIQALIPKATSDAERAWPAYRDALVELGAQYQGSSTQDSDWTAFQKGAFMPGSEGWGAATAFLDEHRHGVDALVAASERPILGFPLGAIGMEEAPLFGENFVREHTAENARKQPFPAHSLLLPHLTRLRDAARVLAADSLLAAERDDGARATRDIIALLSLAQHVAQERLIVNQLVGMAVRTMAVARATMILEWKPSVFSAQQLEAIQRDLNAIPEKMLRLDCDSERIAIEDVVQRIYTDDGAGDGWYRPTAEALSFIGSASGLGSAAPSSGIAFAPIGAISTPSRKEVMTRWNQRVIEAEERSTWSLARQVDTPAPEFDPRDERDIAALVMPALQTAARHCANNRAQVRALQTAIACELFRRTHGHWPASTAELSPRFLSTPAIDDWTGAPPRVKGAGAEFVVYSVGMNRTDDGGNSPSRESSSAPNVKDGDWIWFAPSGNLDRWLPSVQPKPAS